MLQFDSQVIQVTWERIHFYVTVKISNRVSLSERAYFYLLNQSHRVETFFEVINHTDNEYLLKLNITNNGLNRCINNGVYSILIVEPGIAYSEPLFYGTTSELESWGRCFRYLGSTGAYTVTFMLDEYSEKPRLQLLFYNMVKRGMGNLISMPSLSKPASSPKFKKVKKLVSSFKDAIKKREKPYSRKLQKSVYHFVTKHHKKGEKQNILFLSEQDNKLALNMEAIYRRLQERGLEKDFQISFSLRKSTSQKQSFSSTLHMVKLIAEADIILVDDHVPIFDWLVLNKKTKLIQIWHAGAGFKGVGYSRWGHFGCPGPFSCHRQYTYAISGSKNISSFFSEQFGITDEQIIPTGMPRMDQFLNPEYRELTRKKLLEFFPSIQGNFVILFAPTYRGQNRKNAYYPYDMIDFHALYKYCLENNSVVLFKMHPWVPGKVLFPESYKDRFFDLNHYSNINDLFYISDLLITDYSSSIYEFSLLNKPMLFFAFDKVQFSTSRGFHRNYDENVPGKICETFDELMQAIESKDFEFEKCKDYVAHHFEHTDTNNSDRVIDWLILGQLPEIYRNAQSRQQQRIKAERGKSFAELFK